MKGVEKKEREKKVGKKTNLQDSTSIRILFHTKHLYYIPVAYMRY